MKRIEARSVFPRSCGYCGRCDACYDADEIHDLTEYCLVCGCVYDDTTAYPFCSVECALSVKLDNLEDYDNG